MTEPVIRFLPADPPNGPPDDGALADALAAVLIGARRREREAHQAGGGETENDGAVPRCRLPVRRRRSP